MCIRDRGSSWYLGAMTADEAQGGRVERVALGFLPAGRYRATVWEDGATPNELRRAERDVTAADVLSLRLAPAGGKAAGVLLHIGSRITAAPPAGARRSERVSRAVTTRSTRRSSFGVPPSSHTVAR